MNDPYCSTNVQNSLDLLQVVRVQNSKCPTTPLFSMLCLFLEFPISVLHHPVQELCLGLPLPLFPSILLSIISLRSCVVKTSREFQAIPFHGWNRPMGQMNFGWIMWLGKEWLKHKNLLCWRLYHRKEPLLVSAEENFDQCSLYAVHVSWDERTQENL